MFVIVQPVPREFLVVGRFDLQSVVADIADPALAILPEDLGAERNRRRHRVEIDLFDRAQVIVRAGQVLERLDVLRLGAVIVAQWLSSCLSIKRSCFRIPSGSIF